MGLDYVIAPVHHPLVALLDKEDFASQVLAESEEKETISNQFVSI